MDSSRPIPPFSVCPAEFSPCKESGEPGTSSWTFLGLGCRNAHSVRCCKPLPFFAALKRPGGLTGLGGLYCTGMSEQTGVERPQMVEVSMDFILTGHLNLLCHPPLEISSRSLRRPQWAKARVYHSTMATSSDNWDPAWDYDLSST